MASITAPPTTATSWTLTWVAMIPEGIPTLLLDVRDSLARQEIFPAVVVFKGGSYGHRSRVVLVLQNVDFVKSGHQSNLEENTFYTIRTFR